MSKAFIVSRDNTEQREDFVYADIAQEVYHNRKDESYFTTTFVRGESQYVGCLIPLSVNTREALVQLAKLGRITINPDYLNLHPRYPTIYIQNDYD